MQLKSYQKEGVKFLLEHPHRLLADDMGLGKTAQVIVAMHQRPFKRAIIICPASVKYNWVRELEKWSDAKPKDIQVIDGGRDVVGDNIKYTIVNYALLIKAGIHKQLTSRNYEYLIVDEAHYLKTLNSKRSNAVLAKGGLVYNATYKWFLSGTPVLNRPIELFPLLKTMAGSLLKPYDDLVSYGRRFCNGYELDGQWHFNGASNLDDLQERLAPFMLRRTKEEVLKELPPVTESVHRVKVDLGQHPELAEVDFPLDEIDGYMPSATVRRLIAEAKVPQVIDFVTQLLESENKIVVFTYHRSVTESLARGLEQFGPCLVYGGINAKDKAMAIRAFESDESKRVFIGQITSAGQGIDGLQKAASYCVFAEPDWSPGVMDQARDRLRRIGQDHPVFAYYVVAKGTMEEKMCYVVEAKRSVIRQIIGENGPMSLEEAIKELTEAVKENTAKLAETQTIPVYTGIDLVQEPVKEEKPKKAKKPSSKTGSKKKEEEVKDVPAPDVPSADDVRAAATRGVNALGNDSESRAKCREMVAKIRDKYIDVAAKETLADIKEEDRRPFIDEVNSLVESLRQ